MQIKLTKREMRLILVALGNSRDWTDELIKAHMGRFSGKPIPGSAANVRRWTRENERINKLAQELREIFNS